jgi:pimeloyl-ACP methyl ester carboxylesterase
VFAVDMTGYGRSARPTPMNDKCNLSPEQQKGFGVACTQTYPGALTNITSDWNDISAAVDFIRKLRHVDKVNLIGWSQGGPRAGGWTAQHPDRIAKLILLAPAYNRASKNDAPAVLPVAGAVCERPHRTLSTLSWATAPPTLPAAKASSPCHRRC